MSEKELQGGCMCGGVSFSAKGDFRDVIFCHCHPCQKATGHYWASTKVADENLTFHKDTTLKWYNSSTFAKRGFCQECGATLFYKMLDSTATSIGMGAFDEDVTGLQPREHIFMNDKKDYYALNDGLPQHDMYDTYD